jgi:hypothetical protein
LASGPARPRSRYCRGERLSGRRLPVGGEDMDGGVPHGGVVTARQVQEPIMPLGGFLDQLRSPDRSSASEGNGSPR